MIHDLRTLRFEGLHPLVDTRDREVILGVTAHVSRPPLDARRFKQIAELSVRQLNQKPGEERPAGLADFGMREMIRDRSFELSDTFPAVLPNRFFLPVLETDRMFGLVQERGGANVRPRS